MISDLFVLLLELFFRIKSIFSVQTTTAFDREARAKANLLATPAESYVFFFGKLFLFHIFINNTQGTNTTIIHISPSYSP